MAIPLSEAPLEGRQHKILFMHQLSISLKFLTEYEISLKYVSSCKLHRRGPVNRKPLRQRPFNKLLGITAIVNNTILNVNKIFTEDHG